MKIIISYILSFVQFIVGLTGLELLFEYKQTHPDFTLNVETITVGTDSEELEYFYTVFAERKDIDKLVTEFKTI